jgi:predicted Zn-dependent protease
LGLFDPLPLPSHVDDWLAQYREAPQSVADLLSEGGPHAAARARAQGRNVIYLQPIRCERAASTRAAERGATDGGGRRRGPTAEADDSDAALFNALQRYLAAFFHGTPVKLLDPLVVRVSGRRGALLGQEVRWRDFCPGSGQPVPHGQLKAGMLLAALETAGLPEDGFCVLGVTMTDLFIGDDDVFTAGLASCRKPFPAGCFSFYRYREGAGSDAGVLLHRACKTASHEILHLFGIGHCVHRRCLMSGTGHLREDFAAPLELCPVDLAKLKAVLGRRCKLVPRYHSLLGFCEAQPTGFGEHAAWLRRAIAAVDKAGTAGEVIVARVEPQPEPEPQRLFKRLRKGA